jgi:HK97 family phage portal protein
MIDFQAGGKLNILQRLFNRDKPKNALTHESIGWLPMRSAGQNVSPATAMQISAVYACVRVIAEAIAELPLHMYESAGEKQERAYGHPLYRLLHDAPNEFMTSFVFRETAMTHLLLWGNAYVYKQVSPRDGRVLALYPLKPNKMAVQRGATGRLVYTYAVDENDAIYRGEPETCTWDSSDIMHVPGLGFDGLVGYSPIAVARNAIGVAMAAEQYGATFFENNASPGGVLEHPGIVKDPEKLRQSWKSQFSGANAHSIAVLEEGLKYHPIGISPNEAQFLETRKFQVSEIARIFKVPPHMIGDLEKSSFSNIEQQALEFVKYTVDPWVIRLEQAINLSLLSDNDKGRYFAHFNVDGLLRGDYSSRMEGYATARQNGWMSANDIRELESMNRIPEEEGGNAYLVNGNMVPIKTAMNRTAEAAQQTGGG